MGEVMRRREQNELRKEVEEGIESFNIGHIQGGTNAGWKRQFPRRIDPWDCPECDQNNNPYNVNCINCGFKP